MEFRRVLFRSPYDTGSAEQVAEERKLFKRYQEYFKVPDEV